VTPGLSSGPEHGLQIPRPGLFCMTRYDSEKAGATDGAWRHVSVTLSPLDPECEPIVVTVDDEADVQVVAEVLEVPAGDVG
jgi:hypothetical protein